MGKLIICLGRANEPASFWDWAVCTKEEFTEDMKKEGWVLSETTKYLSKKQIEYLNN